MLTGAKEKMAVVEWLVFALTYILDSRESGQSTEK